MDSTYVIYRVESDNLLYVAEFTSASISGLMFDLNLPEDDNGDVFQLDTGDVDIR